MFSQKYTENIGNMWLIMINPQKPVINLIQIFNRFTALIYIYIVVQMLYRISYLSPCQFGNIINPIFHCILREAGGDIFLFHLLNGDVVISYTYRILTYIIFCPSALSEQKSVLVLALKKKLRRSLRSISTPVFMGEGTPGERNTTEDLWQIKGGRQRGENLKGRKALQGPRWRGKNINTMCI